MNRFVFLLLIATAVLVGNLRATAQGATSPNLDSPPLYIGKFKPVECEFSFTRAPGCETARDNGFATYSLPAPREAVVDFLRGMSA
jgi:hypothetical protein